jgi:hypothetical protein
MPARGQERPERRITTKASQVGEARRVGPAGQMRQVTVRGHTARISECRSRGVRKHAMRRGRAVRPVAERRSAPARNMETRAGAPEPCVRHMPETTNTANASASAEMRCKMRHTAAADMSRKMWGAAAHVRSSVRYAAARCRPAAAASWRRRPGANREAHGQAERGNTRRNGSSLDHNVVPK